MNHLKAWHFVFPSGLKSFYTDLEQMIYVKSRAALTTHELEWLEPWGKLAELELKGSNRELVYVRNTNVTQST